MVIYVDSLIVLNLIVNYLILMATAKISGVVFSRIRLLIAAGFGATYAAAVLLPELYFLSGFAGKAVVCFVMTSIAFGLNKTTVRLALMTCGVSLAFAGAAMVVSLMGGNLLANISVLYVPVDMKTLLFVTVIVYVVLSLVYKKTASRFSRSLGTAEISALGRKVQLKYLSDTGNSLTDPMTNAPVTVATMDVFRKISGVEPESDPVVLLQKLHSRYPDAKTRLIPFSTIGNSNGIMLALKCESIKLEGYEIKGGLLAFSPNKICDDGSYEAIAGCIGG